MAEKCLIEQEKDIRLKLLVIFIWVSKRWVPFRILRENEDVLNRERKGLYWSH